MKIDLTDLLNGSKSEIPVDTEVDLSDIVYATYCPLKKPVRVCGRLFTKAEVIYLELNISYTMDGFCDRCADSVSRDYSLDVSKILVSELQNEDNDDDYVIVENHCLDIDALVNEEVSLNLPSKFLCSDDCKGLCMKCGANLNYEKCDCKSDVDPRMAALLQLLDEQ